MVKLVNVNIGFSCQECFWYLKMAFKFNEVLGCVFMVLGWGVISIIPFFDSIVLVDYRIWLSRNLSVNLTFLLDQVRGLFMAAIFLISGSVLIYCS